MKCNEDNGNHELVVVCTTNHAIHNHDQQILEDVWVFFKIVRNLWNKRQRKKKKKKEFDNLYACNKLKQENTTNNKVKKNNDDIRLKEIIGKEVKLVLATKTDV